MKECIECQRCLGSGFILYNDCGVSGCEEYIDCLKCSGTGLCLEYQHPDFSFDKIIPIQETKRRKIIL
jgi:hypothetical protein